MFERGGDRGEDRPRRACLWMQQQLLLAQRRPRCPTRAMPTINVIEKNLVEGVRRLQSSCEAMATRSADDGSTSSLLPRHSGLCNENECPIRQSVTYPWSMRPIYWFITERDRARVDVPTLGCLEWARGK